METFLGKSESCTMTAMLGAFKNSIFDGKTILSKRSEENNKHRYLNIGGDMICSFLSNDEIYNYISNMGNNLTSYSLAIGEENISFLNPLFRFVEKEKIHHDDDIELFEYYMSNSQIQSFKKLQVYKVHSNYD